MAAASLTPRVRILVVCDDVTPSDTEIDVYTLEGVRQQVFARGFPCSRDFNLFLLLSCPRHGRYEGLVRIVNEQTSRVVRVVPFSVTFAQDNDSVPVVVDVTNCRFAQPGGYGVEIWLTARNGESAQNGEQVLYVRQDED